jgi:hypothetical protein
MRIYIQGVIALALLCIGTTPVCGIEVGNEICPGRIASLTPVPGNLDAEFASERIEIRQCPLDPAKLSGWVQLVAWEKGAAKPSLIINTEDSGFYQYAFIQGAYAFEIIGGKASEIVVIAFEGGKPRIALQRSTLSHPKISTDAESLTVTIRDEKGRQQEYSFPKSGAPSGRK